MLRSMTGFGRCFLEESRWTQVWEVRSVNSRHLELRWHLPQQARHYEAELEKVVRRHASRGRVEVGLNLTQHQVEKSALGFNEALAGAMLGRIGAFAAARGDVFTPDYTRLMGFTFLWDQGLPEADDAFDQSLSRGLALALDDWNESREQEAKGLEKDLRTRVLRMEEWVALLAERAPGIKEDRFATVRERLAELLDRCNTDVDDSRFLQEIALMADKLDVSEELTRLHIHFERFGELLTHGADAGKKLDFTLQEMFREITTCGNKIQDAQLSRLVVDIKAEMEKCREQVQNIE